MFRFITGFVLGALIFGCSCKKAPAEPGAGYAQAVGAVGSGGFHEGTGHHPGVRHHGGLSHRTVRPVRGVGVRLRQSASAAPAAETPRPGVSQQGDRGMTPAVLAVVSALAAQPAAAASTDALKLACGGDAMRLCAASIPQGILAIKSCMQAHWASVSATCKTVAENKGEPLKVAPPSKVITPKHLPKINLRPVLSGSSSQGVSQPPIITSKTQERPMD